MNIDKAGRMAKIVGMIKAPKTAYLLRHPLKGTRNLLALRGAKSLLRTRAAAVTAAVAATATVMVPLAFKVFNRSSDA